MAAISYCPRCAFRLPHRPEAGNLEPKGALDGPPSPPGEYHWGGWTWGFDYGRIAFLLGKRPDEELARAISSPRRNVTELRRRLKIPPHRVLLGFEHLLGKLSDVALAKRAGCSKATTKRARKKAGISPMRRGQMHAEHTLQAYLDDLEREFGARPK